MKTRIRVMTSTVAVALALLVGAGPALAHYCTNANKQAGAGSIGVYNVVTETFTPAKRLNPNFDPETGKGLNSGFVTFTDGEHFSFDVYVHQTLPEGALAAGPGGDDHCDGQGVDSALACLGITH